MEYFGAIWVVVWIKKLIQIQQKRGDFLNEVTEALRHPQDLNFNQLINSMSPQTMNNKGFGHLKTKLFTIKNPPKYVGFGGPWLFKHF